MRADALRQRDQSDVGEIAGLQRLPDEMIRHADHDIFQKKRRYFHQRVFLYSDVGVHQRIQPLALGTRLHLLRTEADAVFKPDLFRKIVAHADEQGKIAQRVRRIARAHIEGRDDRDEFVLGTGVFEKIFEKAIHVQPAEIFRERGAVALRNRLQIGQRELCGDDAVSVVGKRRSVRISRAALLGFLALCLDVILDEVILRLVIVQRSLRGLDQPLGIDLLPLDPQIFKENFLKDGHRPSAV